MSRTTHIAGSFAIVLVLYWAYALVAVPLIEPSVDPTRRERVSRQEIDGARAEQDRRVSALQGLFAPGAWELDNPKILESDHVKLLFGEYTNQGDGKIRLSPCTFIFTPDGPLGAPAERPPRAVILQAPEGAILEFDQPLDLSRAKVGRLLGGRLLGEITIRSAGTKPDTSDDLWIVTRDVQLSEEAIWTHHSLRFRLGPHFGHGRRMHIKLLSGDDADTDISTDKKSRHGPNIAGVKSFEIRHVERLHLQFSGAEMSPGTLQPPAQDRPASSPAAADSDIQVEIACRGPFRFDVIRQVATFEDRVEVTQIHPDGLADQLHCELLSVHFERRKDSKADGSKPGPPQGPPSLADLQPRRIEARGHPVVVRSPQKQLEARGQRLEYDLLTRRILLDGPRPVSLVQGPNEIHAGYLQYEPAAPGRAVGQLVAEGPGWLRGRMGDRPDQQLEARWNKELSLRPHEQNQVISLTGGAELKFHAVGSLAAEEIHFWMTEPPRGGPTKQRELRPDRMLARNNVTINSAQLAGTVDQLQVWFEEVQGQNQNQDQNQDASGQAPRRLPPVASRETGPWRSGEPSESTPPTDPPPKDPLRRFEIAGRLLQAKVTIRGDEAELSELTVEGNVQFLETHTAQAGQQPLAVRGDRLHVDHAGRPHAAVTVTGSPAHFEGRGLGLTGSNINLNGGTNRLWIDGPGTMDLPPLGRDPQGRKSAGPMNVQWQDRMEFDGRTVRFEGAVTAASRQQQLRTETLEVVFQEPIRFDELHGRPNPQIEQVRARGGIFMENQTHEQNRPTAIEKMEAQNLVIDNVTGAVKAAGPGRMRTVRHGSTAPNMLGQGMLGPGMLDDAPENTDPPSSTTPSSTADRDTLVYLNVRFQGSITGNLHRRTMTFNDRVRAVYGPVDSWQTTLPEDDPDRLGPNGALLSCDHLSVTEMPTPGADRPAMELEARGNTRIEGRDFTARGTRMTYAEAKGLLILEGDGRTDAALYLQRQIGGATNEFFAKKIHYWPRTKRLSVSGARSLEMNQLPMDGESSR